MHGDLLGALRWTTREQPPDLVRHPLLQIVILVRAPGRVALPPVRPGVLVRETRGLRPLERILLHEQPLPLIAPARSTEAHHHRPQAAAGLCASGQRGVAGRQEHQMVHLRARHAHRARVLHDQQPAALCSADRAGEILQRRDHDKLGRTAPAFGEARTLLIGELGREPVGAELPLDRLITAGREAQRLATSRAREILGFARLEPSRRRPAAKQLQCQRHPLRSDLNQLLEIVDAALPPRVQMDGVKPSQAGQHIDRGDELTLRQCLLGRTRNPPLESFVVVRGHRNHTLAST